MMYFTNCKTAEELKKEYKKIARQLHPDNGGSTAQFQEMQAEFESAWNRLKDVHVNKDGEMYTSTKETEETASEFMDLINLLLSLIGIEIEICGSWIWITGNTRAFKDQLKSFGFRWAHNKQAWYFHREPYHKKSKKSLTLDEIRKMYGSQKVSGSRQDPDAIPAF